MQAPDHPYKGITELSIPVKIYMRFTGSVWGKWIFVIEFPTLGITKKFSYDNKDDMKAFMEFVRLPCDCSCHDCEHRGYPSTCYKLKHWETKRREDKTEAKRIAHEQFVIEDRERREEYRIRKEKELLRAESE